MTALEKDSYLKMIADLKKGMLSDATPAFTLVDLKGNKINLQNLKNKVAIIDFGLPGAAFAKPLFKK
jgi:cytochrome oxidase Cu insertion factor (SCO1/SenC/PrrC family)